MVSFNSRRYIIAIFLSISFCLANADELYHSNIANKKCCLTISHALGGIDGNAYTNSLEALTENLRHGSQIFEVDLSKTSDGVWVATHDWDSWAKNNGYPEGPTPNLKKFIQTRIKRNDGRTYTPLTFNDIEKIMLRNPRMQLITDTKYNLRELESELAKSKVKNQIIWQAYNFNDIDYLKAKGYDKVILTLYKLGKIDPTLLTETINTKYSKDIIAVAMPLRIYQERSRQNTGLAVPIYLHGNPASINSRQLHLSLRDQVAGFYLD